MHVPPSHPGGNPGANVKSIFHRCYLREVAFEWDLTKETIYLPLGCVQGGKDTDKPLSAAQQHDEGFPADLRTTNSQNCEAVPRRARI